MVNSSLMHELSEIRQGSINVNIICSCTNVHAHSLSEVNIRFDRYIPFEVLMTILF